MKIHGIRLKRVILVLRVQSHICIAFFNFGNYSKLAARDTKSLVHLSEM